MPATYFPDVFAPKNLQQAREIILTGEGPGADTDTRWAEETPYVAELIQRGLTIGPDTLLLDFGCGVGRMAKALIEATGCRVIGADISMPMLQMSAGYVDSDRFMPLHTGQLDALVARGLRVDAFISIWVLQHCFAPADEIARIGRALAPGGQGFVLNMKARAVPALLEDGKFVWAGDGQDVAALLRQAFTVAGEGAPDQSRSPKMAAEGEVRWFSLRQPA